MLTSQAEAIAKQCVEELDAARETGVVDAVGIIAKYVMRAEHSPEQIRIHAISLASQFGHGDAEQMIKSARKFESYITGKQPEVKMYDMGGSFTETVTVTR